MGPSQAADYTEPAKGSPLTSSCPNLALGWLAVSAWRAPRAEDRYAERQLVQNLGLGPHSGPELPVEAAIAPRPEVLVVEDETNIRELICLHLGLEHMSCVQAADGQAGLQLARERPFDLVILDLMLPGLDGVTVCRAIRRESRNVETPILMLTARREESDKVVGLDSGADDYLTKPFGVRELMARVRALLRRGPRAAAAEVSGTARPVTYKHIEIDPSRRRVRVGGRDVELTSQEFQLLYVLLSNPGIVFSREALLGRVWKDDTFVTGRSVDTLVKRVRRKIEENPAEPSVVLTVWGTGYKAADV
ncbi:MAG: response regulator transcription factor [Acidobacteria bacterium]|nr:response regulator transcription factor [Acidobacteriota bacterium]